MEPAAEIPTYQAHENGWRAFDRAAARKYADFYRVNVDWLDEGLGPVRGRQTTERDPLAGLSVEQRREALDYIAYLKSKP